MEIFSPLSLAFFLALTVERMIEWFIKPSLAPKIKDYALYVTAVRLLTLLLGGFFAYGLGIDLISPLLVAAGVTPLWAWLPALITALIIGGGSTFLHDIWPGSKDNAPSVNIFVPDNASVDYDDEFEGEDLPQ